MGGAGQGDPRCFVAWATGDLGFENRIEISRGTGIRGREHRHKLVIGRMDPATQARMRQRKATGTRSPRDITEFQGTTCSGL